MIEQSTNIEEIAMKLWLLIPGPDESAWTGWDMAQKFVIRAETEEQARKLADSCGGEETITGEYDWQPQENHPWLDSNQSTCAELLPDGEEEVISSEVNYG